ncbi:MAG: hypothetical protein ACOCM4_01365 [Acetivibrio ethanolgignens]
MQDILMGIFLGGCAWTDGRRKEISLFWLAVWMVVGGIWLAAGLWRAGLGSPEELLGRIGGIAVGIFLLAVSILSHGQVGFGDGLVFLVCGLFLDFWESSLLLLGGLILLLGRFFAGFLYKRLTGERDSPKEQPLMPYVFLAYVGGLLWNL